MNKSNYVFGMCTKTNCESETKSLINSQTWLSNFYKDRAQDQAHAQDHAQSSLIWIKLPDEPSPNSLSKPTVIAKII